MKIKLCAMSSEIVLSSDDDVQLVSISSCEKRPIKVHDISDSDSDTEQNFRSCSPKKLKTVSSRDHKVEDNLSNSVSSSESCNTPKPKCKYGSSCYRKNVNHLRDFDHTDNHTTLPTENNSFEPANKFNLYFNTVRGIDASFNTSQIALTVHDTIALEKSKLRRSAQFNFMFDLKWLLEQFPTEYRSLPMLVVHGESGRAKATLEQHSKTYPNISFSQAPLPIPYGTHHTKMMLLLYDKGLRVVIMTANAYEEDWKQKTQGIWCSPLLPALPFRRDNVEDASSCSGESVTNFRSDLLQYLSEYRDSKVNEWCAIIKQHDFSACRVFLIGSVPGRHVGHKKTAFGHLKMRKTLNLYGPSRDVVSSSWPLVCQCSSIGSLGADHDAWLTSEFGVSLTTTKQLAVQSRIRSNLVQVIFPSVDDVRCSLEGYPAGGSIPYMHATASKQTWLNKFFCRWRCNRWGRTVASPHIKSYCRPSPDYTRIAWLLITSANLSKAAWGQLEKSGSQLMIRSYELGVLFLPEISGGNDGNLMQASFSVDEFPVPVDLPPVPYVSTDQPWILDIPHKSKPDRHGMMWCPPTK